MLSGGKAGFHKIQGIGAGFIPKNYNADVVDEIIQIANETAFATARELAYVEGVAGGISTGATVAVALEVAERKEMAGKKIVVIGSSACERYISTDLFDGM